MTRREREKQTIRKMIGLYCRGNHGTAGGLCTDCRDLLEYAETQLERCPHTVKPACSECTIRCYAPEQREAMRKVMRYAGPRMLFCNPWAAFVHAFRTCRLYKGKMS